MGLTPAPIKGLSHAHTVYKANLNREKQDALVSEFLTSTYSLQNLRLIILANPCTVFHKIASCPILEKHYASDSTT